MFFDCENSILIVIPLMQWNKLSEVLEMMKYSDATKQLFISKYRSITKNILEIGFNPSIQLETNFFPIQFNYNHLRDEKTSSMKQK